METRVTPLYGRGRKPPPRTRSVRAFAAWAALSESSQYGSGGPVTSIMAAKKRRTTKAAKTAVTDKLRAMVRDVEHWPLSEQLLATLESLDDIPGDEPPPPELAPPISRKTSAKKS